MSFASHGEHNKLKKKKINKEQEESINQCLSNSKKKKKRDSYLYCMKVSRYSSRYIRRNIY